MKPNFTKHLIILCNFAILAFSASAQFTETFESQTPNANSFTSNSKVFTLTNSFLVFSSRAGYGYQRSNRFIDNSSNVALNQINAIKTSSAGRFTLKNLWVFVSTDGGNNPSVDGSLIITGKLGGVVQFTINKTTGFTASYTPDNGYCYVDFSTDGGNNSLTSIDQVDFQLQGNFNYIGIDNFTWAPASVLPISLLSYSASLRSDNIVKLSWQTAFENNTKNFIIEKSIDGTNFQKTGSVSAARNSRVAMNYTFTDMAPSAGVNYYRLEEEDQDGNIKYLAIKSVSLGNRFSKSTVYPNPVIGNSFTLKSDQDRASANTYFITDMSGRIIKTGVITSGEQQVNLSQIAPGNYSIKLSNGDGLIWQKK